MTKKSRTHCRTDAETSLLASESDSRTRDQQTAHVQSGPSVPPDEARPNAPFCASHRIASAVSSAHSALGHPAFTPCSFDAISSDCSRTQLLAGHPRYGLVPSARSSCLHLPLDPVANASHSRAASWCFDMCHQNHSGFNEPALQALLTRYFANSQRRGLLCYIVVLCTLSSLLGTLELCYSAALTHRVVYFFAHAVVTACFAAFLHPGCGAVRADSPSRFGRNRLCTDLFLSVILVLHSAIFVILNLPVAFTTQTSIAGASATTDTSSVAVAAATPLVVTSTRLPALTIAPTTPAPQHFMLADGLWQLLVVIVLLFLFLPLRFYVPLLIAACLTTAHTVTGFVYANRLPDIVWRLVIANLVAAVCVTVVCAWLNIRAERLQRNVFVHAKSCAESRICLQNAQDRCERLLQVTFPEKIASQLTKACIAFGDTAPEKRFAQKAVPACTFLLVDIIGVSQLLSATQPIELLRLINSLVTAFDIISQQFRCYRLRLLGSSYYAACGVPDAAPDHVLSAVQAAFSYIAAVKQFVEETGINLGVKVVLHSSSSAICGVFGVRRMAFDVWCADLDILNEIRLYTPASQIGASKSVADLLNGLFTTEPLSFRRLSTYRYDHQPTQADLLVMFLIKQRTAPTRKFTLPQRYFASAVRAGPGAASTAGFVDAAISMQQTCNTIPQSNASQNDGPFSDLTEMLLSNTVTANNSVGDTREGSLHARTANDPFGLTQQFNANDTLLVHFNHALKLQSLSKMRQTHTSNCSLAFRSAERERKYQNMPDENFEKSILFVLFVIFCNAALQAAVLPKTLFLLFLVLIALAWNSLVLIALLAAKLRCIAFDVRRSKGARLAILLVSASICFAICEINVLYCRNDAPPDGEVPGQSAAPIARPTARNASSPDERLQCYVPPYLYTNCLFACLLLAVFTEFSTMSKFVLMSTISVVYVLTVSLVHLRLINDFDAGWNVLVPTPVHGVLLVTTFLLLFTIYGARLEWYRRVQFLWSSQMDEAIQSSTVLHHKLTDTMYSLMPESVLAEYLDGRLRNSNDPFCIVHKKAAVLFLSVCGLENFEQSVSAVAPNPPNGDNKQTSTQPRTALNVGGLLDTVFTTFDTVLAQDKYRLLEKVKNVSNAYHVAAGLQLDELNGENQQLFAPFVALLLDLLAEMSEVLENISSAHQVRLSMKCGLASGPVIAGVIGGKRIQYELFGETVLQAFGLEQFASPREVLCSEEVVQLLRSHYEFDGPRELPAMSTSKKRIAAFALRGVRRLQLQMNVPLNLADRSAQQTLLNNHAAAVQPAAHPTKQLAVNETVLVPSIAAQQLAQNANGMQFNAPTITDEARLWQQLPLALQMQLAASANGQIPLTHGNTFFFTQQVQVPVVQANVEMQQSAGSVSSHSAGRQKKHHHHHKHRHNKAHDNAALVKSPSGELIQLNVFTSNVEPPANTLPLPTPPQTLAHAEHSKNAAQNPVSPQPAPPSEQRNNPSEIASGNTTQPPARSNVGQNSRNTNQAANLTSSSKRSTETGSVERNASISEVIDKLQPKLANEVPTAAANPANPANAATGIQMSNDKIKEKERSPSTDVPEFVQPTTRTKPPIKPRSQSTNSSNSTHSHTPVSVIMNFDRQLSLPQQSSAPQPTVATGSTIQEETLDFPSYKPPAPFAGVSLSVKRSAESLKQSTSASSMQPPVVTSPKHTLPTNSNQPVEPANGESAESEFAILLRKKIAEAAAEPDHIMRESRISVITDNFETDMESAAEDPDGDHRRDSGLLAPNLANQSEYESNFEPESDVDNYKPSSEVSSSDEEERNIKNFYVSDYEPDLPKRNHLGELIGPLGKRPSHLPVEPKETSSTSAQKQQTVPDKNSAPRVDANNSQSIVVNRFAEPPTGGVSKKIQRMKMAALQGKHGNYAGSCTSTLYGSSNERSEYENLDSDFSDRVRIETSVLERLRQTHREMQAKAANGIDFDVDVDVDVDLEPPGEQQRLVDANMDTQLSNWLAAGNRSSVPKSASRSGAASDYDNNNLTNSACPTAASSATSTAHRNAVRHRMLQKLGLSRRQSGETTDEDERHEVPTTTDEEDESEYISELDQANATDDPGNSTDDYMTYSAIFNKLRSANLIKPSSTAGSVSSAAKRHVSEGSTAAKK